MHTTLMSASLCFLFSFVCAHVLSASHFFAICLAFASALSLRLPVRLSVRLSVRLPERHRIAAVLCRWPPSSPAFGTSAASTAVPTPTRAGCATRSASTPRSSSSTTGRRSATLWRACGTACRPRRWSTATSPTKTFPPSPQAGHHSFIHSIWLCRFLALQLIDSFHSIPFHFISFHSIHPVIHMNI